MINEISRRQQFQRSHSDKALLPPRLDVSIDKMRSLPRDSTSCGSLISLTDKQVHPQQNKSRKSRRKVESVCAMPKDSASSCPNLFAKFSLKQTFKSKRRVMDKDQRVQSRSHVMPKDGR